MIAIFLVIVGLTSMVGAFYFLRPWDEDRKSELREPVLGISLTVVSLCALVALVIAYGLPPSLHP